MARNCEKKFVGLNRIFLERQRKEELEKNPKRPALHKLHSASEVKRWIPNIKREIDYNLELSVKDVGKRITTHTQQLSGARQHKYPDHNIQEFQENVERLEREYKSFVRKVFELDPSTTGIPWQPRGYVSKRKQTGSPNPIMPKKICTPILDNEDRDERITELDHQSSSEQPLKMTITATKTAANATRAATTTPATTATTKATTTIASTTTTSTSQAKKKFFKENVELNQENPSILGLDYSSSDED